MALIYMQDDNGSRKKTYVQKSTINRVVAMKDGQIAKAESRAELYRTDYVNQSKHLKDLERDLRKAKDQSLKERILFIIAIFALLTVIVVIHG